jgi:hypothetical protein
LPAPLAETVLEIDVQGQQFFDTPVPLIGPIGFYEKMLPATASPGAAGRTLLGRSVRLILDPDFAAIVFGWLRNAKTGSLTPLPQLIESRLGEVF